MPAKKQAKTAKPEQSLQRYEKVGRKSFSSDVCVRIVQLYATFNTPAQVVKAIGEEFGLELRPVETYAYDPKRPVGADLDPALVELFEETRDRYKKSIEDIPIANAVYRVKELQRLFNRAQEDQKPGLMLQALEQAAKETGGAFKRQIQVEHTGLDGTVLAAPVINVLFGSPTAPAPVIDITPSLPAASLMLEAGEPDGE